MTTDKQDAYKTTEYIGNRDLRLSKLKKKMREHIRRFHYHPVLTDGWVKMADSISQVAEVSFMEMGVPFKTDSKVNDVLGRKADGTLWDQENDQLAVKILIEEGKINLCLRLLHEFKQKAVVHLEEVMSVRAEVGKKKIGEDVVMLRVEQFEKGMGIIVHFAFQHEEVLQILDLSVLLQNTAIVLKNIENRSQLYEKPPKRFCDDFNGTDKLQETIIFCYLASVGHHLEQLDEDRVMGLIDELDILTLSINHMYKNHAWYATDVLAAYFVFLHNVFDSEMFTSDREAYIHSEELKYKLICLNDKLLDQTLTDTKLSKRDVSKFSELINNFRFDLERSNV